jgi:hypothetical protein
MLDAPLPSKRRRVTPRQLSPDEARARILAKLQKAGRKGTLSLLPSKSRAIFEAVLLDLETQRQLFIDRRKARPRIYLWELRPAIPSVDSVAEELCEFAANRFPLLCSPSDFKKRFGKDREKVALLTDALKDLTARRLLAGLEHRSGKKEVVLYISTAAFRASFPADEQAGGSGEATIEAAYRDLVRRGGFPAVPIAELQQASGTSLEALKAWLLARHRTGQVVLSLGDWSLATAAQQAAALELGGERYLQARLLE